MEERTVALGTPPRFDREMAQDVRRLVRERNLTSVHMGNDALYHWWEARSRSGISEWEIAGSTLRT